MTVIDNGPGEGAIDKLYAIISLDKHGNESIVATIMKSGVIAPMIGSKASTIKMFEELCRENQIQDHLNGRTLHIAVFTEKKILREVR